MECLSPENPCEQVVLVKSAQIGASTVALAFIGYVIENAPGPLLSVMPTHAASLNFVQQKADPMLEGNPVLSAIVTKRRSRQPGNSARLKMFPGGLLSFTGANSATGLRSVAARYLVGNEIDGWPSDAAGEGDPVSLAIARTITFKSHRKIFLLSTPLLEGFSRIQKAHDEGDCRKFYVPCPHCSTFQVLEWQAVKWPGGDHARAWILCQHCGEAIHEHHKPTMLLRGKWMATQPGNGKCASFQISALYSPFISWGELAQERHLCGDDPARLQTFFNTALGLPWADRASPAMSPETLFARASNWGAQLPPEVLVLTCGVDCQQTYLAVEIVGWGRGEESWSLYYDTIPGNPNSPEPWVRLDELLRQTWGGKKISVCCVDAGNWSSAVYAFTGPVSMAETNCAK
jgi:phage terminase large subunit GpA-like protein